MVDSEKIMKQTDNCPRKVYLESSPISNPLKIKNFKEEELKALSMISNNPRFKLYISEVSKREIAKTPDLKIKYYLEFIYGLIKKIPEENIIKSVPALFNNVMFNEAAFNGSVDREDPLFTSLKEIFDEDDAEHIFQAEKDNFDYFLTLDYKTILNRARERRSQLETLNLKIHLVSPKELVREES